MKEAATEMQEGKRGCQVTPPEAAMDWSEAEPHKRFGSEAGWLPVTEDTVDPGEYLALAVQTSAR